MRTESIVLADVMNKTRQLTSLYLNLLKNADPYQVYEVDGKKLNSILWIKAHLSVTENWLLLRSTGAEAVRIPWAKQFGIGSVVPAKEEYPAIDEIDAVFNDVHQKAISHVSAIPDDKLELVNTTGFEFAGENSTRSVIIHAIRHEGTHSGHLGWLCKLNGIKTI